jgi:hypothetical protein
MIIDCGSLGSQTRGPTDFTKAQAVVAIDTILTNHTADPNLVISHGDEDHFGYLDSVLDHHQFGQIWQGGLVGDYPAPFLSLLTDQESNGATLHQNLAAGFHNDQFELDTKLSCGLASTYVLTANSGNSKNGRSLILSIDYGDFSAIFTGDAEAPTESSAIDNYHGAVKATVLSGSHHGADTHGSNGSSKGVSQANKSGWPAATSPEVMIYSHGRQFGHPRCAITSNYHETLAIVPSHQMHCGNSNTDNTPTPFPTDRAEYSTEVSGTIAVTTDGSTPLQVNCQGAGGCDAEIVF